jgi:ATP synthase protein I
MPASGPEDLRSLGDRLDAVQRTNAARDRKPPPTSLSIAFRFSTEMVAGLVVGGGLGWCIDWAMGHWSGVHTKPWGMIVFFILGAAAGIRNVLKAAKDLNAEIASNTKDAGE